MNKVYEARLDQIVALSELLSNYIQRGGDITPAMRKRITAYRFALALMKSDDRLAPIAAKFNEVISAVEKNNFTTATQLSAEALALGERVMT